MAAAPPAAAAAMPVITPANLAPAPLPTNLAPLPSNLVPVPVSSNLASVAASNLNPVQSLNPTPSVSTAPEGAPVFRVPSEPPKDVPKPNKNKPLRRRLTPRPKTRKAPPIIVQRALLPKVCLLPLSLSIFLLLYDAD